MFSKKGIEFLRYTKLSTQCAYLSDTVFAENNYVTDFHVTCL